MTNTRKAALEAALRKAVSLYDAYDLVCASPVCGQWINEARAALASPPDDQIEDGRWTCRHCGVSNPGVQLGCWKCGLWDRDYPKIDTATPPDAAPDTRIVTVAQLEIIAQGLDVARVRDAEEDAIVTRARNETSAIIEGETGQ